MAAVLRLTRLIECQNLMWKNRKDTELHKTNQNHFLMHPHQGVHCILLTTCATSGDMMQSVFGFAVWARDYGSAAQLSGTPEWD